MSRKYPSDLTDEQWQVLRPLLPSPAPTGRKPIDRRWILNAILYVVRTGCQWRQLPKDFPPWKTVYTVFWRFRRGGTWKRIHDALRERERKRQGKRATPTVAIVDSQSIRTAEGGEDRGYDAGKKITGRKRHLAVDTLGLVLAVVVHTADLQDHDGVLFVFKRLEAAFTRLKVVFADGAYQSVELTGLSVAGSVEGGGVAGACGFVPEGLEGDGQRHRHSREQLGKRGKAGAPLQCPRFADAEQPAQDAA
jgi:putative transposase